MTTQEPSAKDNLSVELNGQLQRFLWRSENGSELPIKVLCIDDTCTADQALKLARSGTALVWSSDFQNARLLLQAMSRRLDKRKRTRDSSIQLQPQNSLAPAFEAYREDQKNRAQILGKLLIAIDCDHKIRLKRAPNVVEACEQAYGVTQDAYVISLRELHGVISAFEWRKKGVAIDLTTSGLGAFKLTPHFGVFSPIRGEYLKLVADCPLPKALELESTAFDIGTGTGILALILAKRGVKRIIATDQSARAVLCASANVLGLGLEEKIEVMQTNLFPQLQNPSNPQPSKAALIVCNPPWLPSPASDALDSAVFDPASQMLKGFLNALRAHLTPKGEGWLVMSDFAEHLGLRPREQFMQWIDAAGLEVLGKLDTRAEHKKASDASDPFFSARSKELTSLWRLGAKGEH